MNVEITVFIILVTIITLFQVATAEKPRVEGTVYNLLDRASWIIAGVATIAIGIWRPWFTESLWKAIIFPPLFLIGLAALFMLSVGTVLSPTAKTSTQFKIQITLLVFLFFGIFFGLKSCGT